MPWRWKSNKQPKRFDRLFYKVDLRNLSNRALLFLPTEEIARIQGNLQSMGMLLEPPVIGHIDPLIGWRSLTLLRLLHEARNRAGKLLPEQPLAEGDEIFLAQLLAISRSATDVLESATAYKSPWGSLMAQQPEQQDLLPDPQYFFSGDGSLAFLLARPDQGAGSLHRNEERRRDADDPANVAGRYPRSPVRPDRSARAGKRRDDRLAGTTPTSPPGWRWPA